MSIPPNVLVAFGLTALAGLSTGIGSAIAYFIRKPRVAYLSFSLGLSAGVMIYVSFMELLPSAIEKVSEVWAVLAFFTGIGLIAVIDLLVPEPHNPHNYQGIDAPGENRRQETEDRSLETGVCSLETKAARTTHYALRNTHDSQLMRAGTLTALAIGIHNFPEGLATFASALGDVRLGAFIAIAIAIHNIPEGIAVSIPIFYATSNKNKAFAYSFLSGISEPVGALLGYLVLLPILTPAVLAGLLAFVAGTMIYISLDELLPMAHRYGHGHLVIAGIVAGMLIMALSLLML